MTDPFRYFRTSPDIIGLAVMVYVRYPLSLRQVVDLLHERGVDISYEPVRAWWNRLGPNVCIENQTEVGSFYARYAAMCNAIDLAGHSAA